MLINFPAPFVSDQMIGGFEESTEKTAFGFTVTSSLLLLNTDSH